MIAVVPASTTGRVIRLFTWRRIGTGRRPRNARRPVDTATHAVLKLAFENNTAGTNLSLCAGTDADFSAGTAGITLSDSGGPGFKFLTIIDTHALSGTILYVLREVGSADSQFTLTVD
jgi:hypothetical protein